MMIYYFDVVVQSFASTAAMVGFDHVYQLLPLWMVLLVCLRLVLSSYTTLLIASLLFGTIEVMKARKTDAGVWKRLIGDITTVGHRGCAVNAPENTVAGNHVSNGRNWPMYFTY